MKYGKGKAIYGVCDSKDNDLVDVVKKSVIRNQNPTRKRLFSPLKKNEKMKSQTNIVPIFFLYLSLLYKL